MRTPFRCAGAVLVAVGLIAACGASGAKTSKPRTPSGRSTTTVPGVKLIGTVRPQAAPDAATLRAGRAGRGRARCRALPSARDRRRQPQRRDRSVEPRDRAGDGRGGRARRDRPADGRCVARPAAGCAAVDRDRRPGAIVRGASCASGVALDEVDQAWLQQGRSVLTPYADTLAGPYGAPLATIDFDHTGAAASTINSWFSDNTHGKITKLLEASDLENQVVLVLTDAVYLDAQWAHGFDPKRTAPAPFHTAAGTVENVPTMHLDGATIESGPRLGYAAGTGWKAVALPYEGNQLEMDVIVPDDLHAFESTLDGARLASVLGAIQPANVVLSMPKFDVDRAIRPGHAPRATRRARHVRPGPSRPLRHRRPARPFRERGEAEGRRARRRAGHRGRRRDRGNRGRRAQHPSRPSCRSTSRLSTSSATARRARCSSSVASPIREADRAPGGYGSLRSSASMRRSVCSRCSYTRRMIQKRR